MIYTSYFGKLKKLPDNLTPIAICAKCPNGYQGAACELPPLIEVGASCFDHHCTSLPYNRYCANRCLTQCPQA